MSGQVTILQLPTASALTGSEPVPVVQNGVTVQTTTGAIAGAGALNYPFITIGSTSGLTTARQLLTTTGLSLTDSGAGGTVTINMTGSASSLNAASTGFIVKDSASTVTSRSFAVGSGMTISNADGISGNPTFGLSTILQNLASTLSAGVLTLNGTTISAVTIQGTTNQISITNGNGVGGAPTVGLATTSVTAGSYTLSSVTFDAYGRATAASSASTTGSGNVVLAASPTLTGAPIAPTASAGTSTTQIATTAFVANAISSGTGLVNSFSGGSTGLTPSSATTGAITLSGTLAVANGGTGVTTSTGSGNNVLSASPTLTGVPLAPTAAGGTNTQQIATTQYVQSAISASGGGSVTTVSVLSANGFAGTVATPTSTPAITLTTTASGMLRGSAGSILPATAGTDYLAPPSGTAILKAGSGGALANAVAGTDYSVGTSALTTGLLKSTTGTGALSTASSGTDYAPATSGSSILYGNGSGGFSNVTIGSGLTFTTGTLSASGGTVTSVAQTFTGGIISVGGSPITTSGTLALTVAGTSGGIPYFSSGTTWATSAALAANAIVIGGGAGVAPATTTTGSGVLTAIGNAVNTTNGLVTQTATLAGNALLLGGGSGVGIASTTTGTGVVTALGNTTNAASGIVVKDTNSNVSTNNLFLGFTSTPSAGATTVLTVSSTQYQLITGSTSQTFQLPNATTLVNGATFTFNNNSSAGTVSINNGAASPTLLTSVGSGGYVTLILLDNSTQAGSWDYHFQAPSNTTWSTNTFTTGSAIVSTQTVQGTRLISTIATGTAPLTVTSTTQVANLNAATAGTATNATNVALSAGTGATNYLTFSATATGNQPLTTNTLLTYNYTNNTITAGISGGAF